MTASSRTIMDFSFSEDITPIVQAWAAEYQFRVNTLPNGGLDCRRIGGMMMSPVKLQIHQTGSRVHLETWLEVDLLTEFVSLFTAPKESTIQSGETLLWREKEFARRYINPLLEKLKQPPLT